MENIKYLVYFEEKPPITMMFRSYQVKQPKLKPHEVLYLIKQGEDILIRNLTSIPFKNIYIKPAMYHFSTIKNKVYNDNKDHNYFFYLHLYEEMLKNNYKYVHLL